MKIGDKVKVLHDTPYCIVSKGWEGFILDIKDDKIKVWSGRRIRLGHNHYIVKKKYFLPKPQIMLTYKIF